MQKKRDNLDSLFNDKIYRNRYLRNEYSNLYQEPLIQTQRARQFKRSYKPFSNGNNLYGPIRNGNCLRNFEASKILNESPRFHDFDFERKLQKTNSNRRIYEENLFVEPRFFENRPFMKMRTKTIKKGKHVDLLKKTRMNFKNDKRKYYETNEMTYDLDRKKSYMNGSGSTNDNMNSFEEDKFVSWKHRNEFYHERDYLNIPKSGIRAFKRQRPNRFRNRYLPKQDSFSFDYQGIIRGDSISDRLMRYPKNGSENLFGTNQVTSLRTPDGNAFKKKNLKKLSVFCEIDIKKEKIKEINHLKVECSLDFKLSNVTKTDVKERDIQIPKKQLESVYEEESQNNNDFTRPMGKIIQESQLFGEITQNKESIHDPNKTNLVILNENQISHSKNSFSFLTPNFLSKSTINIKQIYYYVTHIINFYLD